MNHQIIQNNKSKQKNWGQNNEKCEPSTDDNRLNSTVLHIK